MDILNTYLVGKINIFVFVMMLIFAGVELFFSNYTLYFLFLILSYLNLLLGLNLLLHIEPLVLLSLKKWVASIWIIILAFAGGVLLSALVSHSTLLISAVPYIVLYDTLAFGIPALIMYCLDSMR